MQLRWQRLSRTLDDSLRQRSLNVTPPGLSFSVAPAAACLLQGHPEDDLLWAAHLVFGWWCILRTRREKRKLVQRMRLARLSLYLVELLPSRTQGISREQQPG